jgi:excisionase family DNA binding protein
LTDADELLTARELAAELKVSLRTLERWRARGIGPAYVRLGRTVRYRRSDVNTWLERQRQNASE